MGTHYGQRPPLNNFLEAAAAYSLRPSQPCPSWTWDAENKTWVPPVPYPTDDGNTYQWNEENQEWVILHQEQYGVKK